MLYCNWVSQTSSLKPGLVWQVRYCGETCGRPDAQTNANRCLAMTILTFWNQVIKPNEPNSYIDFEYMTIMNGVTKLNPSIYATWCLHWVKVHQMAHDGTETNAAGTHWRRHRAVCLARRKPSPEIGLHQEVGDFGGSDPLQKNWLIPVGCFCCPSLLIVHPIFVILLEKLLWYLIYLTGRCLEAHQSVKTTEYRIVSIVYCSIWKL